MASDLVINEEHQGKWVTSFSGLVVSEVTQLLTPPPTYLRVRLERGVSLLITGEHISIFLNTSNQIFKDKVNKTLYPPSLELFTLHKSADRKRGILATGGFYH